MSDSVDTQLFQVLRRQARQDRIVNRVLAECRLILFEAEAPQPTPDVHSGVLSSAGAQSSFRRNNVSRALFFATTAVGRVSRVSPVQTAMRNCTRDEGGPFEVGNQVLISSHRKLLLSKAMALIVAETPGQHSGRQG